jgi:hypothetical protein
MNAFKPQGIEYICGKNRNIYFKMNKNNTALGKTRYIKYKREFIKLSTFIKEHYNKKSKKHINYDKKPNITIINNINDIKDKKIRALFKRTFKKNAKIYIYTSKKIKRGGAAFDVDVSRNNDKPMRREPRTQVFNAALLPSATRKNSDPYPYQLKVEYNKKYDDIIYEITKLSRDKTQFERINNLKYKVSFEKEGKNVEYYIRPHIDFTAPYKRFIINFYVCTDVSSPLKWIKLPLHLSLFINDMIEKKLREGRRTGDEEYEIAMLNTGHIHITSDDKIENFNIRTALELKTKSGAASSRGRAHSSGAHSSGAASPHSRAPSSAPSSSTHTYLIAGSLEKVAYIMKQHGEEIFKDWHYDRSTETDTKHKKFTLFAPKNNKWGASPDGENIELKTYLKKEIFEECFKNLHYIISNIFYILHNKRNLDDGIPSSISSISVGTSDRAYIPYNEQPPLPNINIRYISGDVIMRKGLIDLDDLNKGKIISGRSVVRSRSADPRGRVEVPLYRPSERVRSVDAPTYRPSERRDGRGHSAEPPRGRTGRDGWDGRHPVARTGYRHGGKGSPLMPMPTSMHTPTPTPTPTNTNRRTDGRANNPLKRKKDEEEPFETPVNEMLVDIVTKMREDSKRRKNRELTQEDIQNNKKFRLEQQAIIKASNARDVPLIKQAQIARQDAERQSKLTRQK